MLKTNRRNQTVNTKTKRYKSGEKIPDKLPKKHLLVAVQTVNDEVHEATNLPTITNTQNWSQGKKKN